MDEALRRLIEGMYGDIAALMAVRDRFTAAGLGREFERILVEYHLAAYFAGRGDDELSPRADLLMGAAISAEIGYSRAFLGKIDTLSDAQATARALQYTGAIKASYSKGKHWLWDLPFHAGDGGTPCLTNCRCRWDVQVQDLEELDANAYWRVTAGESCAGCVARAKGNPYVFKGGALQ